MPSNYRDLLVWKKSVDLVEMIYLLVRKLPKEELYGISDQMRRAAVSVPSNIAEGQQRDSDKDFKRFLAISRGSVAELETQLIICGRLGYLGKSDIDNVLQLCYELRKMLSSLMLKLKDQ